MIQSNPKWLISLLRWWLKDDLQDEVIGDLIEAFNRRRITGKSLLTSQLLFFKETLLCLKWSESRFSHSSSSSENLSIRQFQLAFRFLKRNSKSTSIHLFGFSLGITACLLLFNFFKHERSFDQFHTDSDSIFRVVTETEKAEKFGLSPWPTGPFLENDYPDIKSTRVYHNFRKTPTLTTSNGERTFFEDDLFFVDPSFFEILTFDLIVGDNSSVLDEPNSLVLSVDLAKKIFGTTDVIGKELLFESHVRLRINGIVENAPTNSHLKYKAFASIENIDEIFASTGNTFSHDEWYWTAVNTYIKVENAGSFDPHEFEEELKNFTQRYVPESFAHRRNFKLQPLADIHLKSGDIEDIFVEKRSGIEVRAALILSILLLTVALINFVNLTTSTSFDRLKSITIRRILGSSNWQVVVQMLIEAVVVTILSLLLAYLLIWLILPYFNEFANSNVPYHAFFDFTAFFRYLFIAILIGIGIGIYPALQTIGLAKKLSTKANTTNLKGSGNSLSRKILVTIQLLAAILFIHSSLVVYKQFDLLSTKELGFEKKGVLMIPIKGTNAEKQLTRFSALLEQATFITSVTPMSDVLGESSSIVPYRINNSTQQSNIHTLFVGFDFLPTYELDVVDGRGFETKLASDSSSYLINEAALSYFDGNWKEATLGRGDGRIIGVVKNFHFEDLHQEIKPLIIGINQDWQNFLAVKVSGENLQPIIEELGELWGRFENKKPFNAWFLDQKLQSLYEAEKDQTYLVAIFSFLCISIAAVGLLALITYSVKTKMKEIGIRKVLGASVNQIYLLVSKDFGYLLIWSTLLSFPISQITMTKWLENYPIKIAFGWSYFAVSVGLVAFITYIIISLRSKRAVNLNPVDVIKDE